MPVWAAREQLVKEVAANPTLIVVGETGSGKTTQVGDHCGWTGKGGGGV